MNAAQAELLDRASGWPLLVIGGAPPDGRDLDILVSETARAKLEAAMSAAGFQGDRGRWVRFAAFRAQAVDLVSAGSWGLEQSELDRVLAESAPLPGYERLRRPAPADLLLVLARRQLGVRGPLEDKHRRRIDGALALDPDAWSTAERRASRWHVAGALRALHVDWARGGATVRTRARAAAEAARRDGARLGVRAAADATFGGRPRGRVVALSGIDGSGKSSQAAALADALADLGHDAVVEWSRITYDPALRAIGAPVKLLLARWERGRGDLERIAVRPPSAGGEPPRPGDLAAAGLRARVPALNRLWAVLVALVHAASQRRALRPHLRAGRLVVRDRYVLDATVQLAEVYGEDARLAAALVRRACPTPAVAFWLDVEPDEAYRRKPEEYSVEQLAAHRLRYAAAHSALGAVRIDAAQSPEALAARLGREAWRRLG